METLLQDLRYAFRALLKTPGFTVIAIVTLALGIGANTSIFSIVNALLLRRLPFKDSERIVVVNETVRRETVERRPASYPDFADWRDQNKVFDEIAAFDSLNLTLTGVDEPERITAEVASASYFSLLGVQAAQGRTFLAEEDSVPDKNPVAVLGHSLWKRRFNSDPGLMGKTVKLNDREYTVVGIMPEGFQGLDGGAELWAPMMMVSSIVRPNYLQNRGTRWHQVIARLKSGVSMEQAQSDMDAIASRLEQAHAANKNRGVQIVALREAVVGNIRPALLALTAAVGFVLLIACANMANLLLARAAGRQKEIAVRTALGAARSRLVRQLLTESLLLSLAGGGLGLLLAFWGIDLLVAFIGVQMPAFINVGIDLQLLGFTLFVSIMTGIIFGLAPAIHASKPELNELLKDASKGASGGIRRNRIRRVLVVSEIALALVLLVGAGLMINSFQRLQAFNPGFRIDSLLTARISLPRSYSQSQSENFNRQILERVGALPSVESVSLASNVPLDGNSSATIVKIEGKEPAESDVRVYTHSVSPNFFAAMGIPLIKGRDFTLQDGDQSLKVAVISDSMARRLWPNEDPIGKRISDDEDKDKNPIWLQVVGVVGDVKYRTLIRDQNSDPDVYYPLSQSPIGSVRIAVRTAGDASALVAALRSETLALDPNLPISDISTMEQLISNETAQSRFSALLLGIFASIAMMLAAVGIYGVVSYTASQRTHEIGIRVALGAQPLDILKLILKEGMALLGAGLALGLIGARITTGFLAGQLYDISAHDSATYVMVSLLLALTTMLACCIPARRAMKVDPMTALRYE